MCEFFGEVDDFELLSMWKKCLNKAGEDLDFEKKS